jgi:hypothetical protein
MPVFGSRDRLLLLQLLVGGVALLMHIRRLFPARKRAKNLRQKTTTAFLRVQRL